MTRPEMLKNGLDKVITLPRTMRFTHAGAWAQYFHAHPDELPTGAPCPDRCPAEFAEYANHHLCRMVSLHEVNMLAPLREASNEYGNDVVR